MEVRIALTAHHLSLSLPIHQVAAYPHHPWSQRRLIFKILSPRALWGQQAKVSQYKILSWYCDQLLNAV